MEDEAKFGRAVEMVLAHEGGYVDDPDDPGGETKYGISKRAYPDLDVKALTRDQAVAIYRRDWWDRYGYGRLNDPDVAAKVFDLAVNMGPVAAHRRLQRALRACGRFVAVDGVLGPRTVEATNQADPARLLVELRAEAVAYYVELVLADPRRRKFLRGWLRRACA